jgi:ZIP family zinc transporter
MSVSTAVPTRLRRVSVVGLGAAALLVALSVVAVRSGASKVVVVAWAAFGAMAVAGAVGARSSAEAAGPLVWGYGLASGAMVTSASVFLVPQAIAHHAQFGGFGVAFGLLVGFAGHTVGHRLSHLELPIDRTVAELTVHSLSAGAIIGIVYGNMTVGLTLGLAIVSHKAPAGYAAATRLARRDREWTVLLLPAAGVGLAAVTAGAVSLPASPPVRGLVFGFAAGVFLHVAMDFLPRCELGSEIHEALSVEGDAHAALDRLRTQAVVATSAGGLAVLLAWLAVSA